MSLFELKTEPQLVSDSAARAISEISDLASDGQVRGFIVVAINQDHEIKVADGFSSRMELLGALEYAKCLVARGDD